MDTRRENPRAIIAIAGVVLCLLLLAIPLVRMIGNAVNAVPPTPLSEILLKEDDLAAGIFLKDGATRECNKYLAIESLQAEAGQAAVECYQVRFRTRDKSTTVINAIWLFDNPVRAEFEINRFAELLPAANNIDVHIIPVPGPIGEKSTGSTAIITGISSPLYVTNLYWRRGSAALRLTVLSYRGPVSLDELMMPAQRIEARLESR